MSLKRHFGLRGRQQPETDQVNKCTWHTGYDIFLKLKGIHRGKDYNTSEEVKTMTRIEGSVSLASVSALAALGRGSHPVKARQRHQGSAHGTTQSAARKQVRGAYGLSVEY